MLLDLALEYAARNRDRKLEELKTLIRIPSISGSPDHNGDIEKASIWLLNALRRLQMRKVESTPDHRFVYGEWLEAPGRPTILFYGHFDVQTPGLAEDWRSMPFEPVIREDRLYARGAADMKGSLWAFLQAVESIVKSGDLRVNLKVILDGEQQVGSPSAPKFIEDHKKQLQCDAIISLDGGCFRLDTPSITTGRRGLAYFEIEVRGPKTDQHSGSFGGIVHNPGNALCALVAGMHDSDGHVTLPGFYDSVRSLSKEERESIARTAMSEAEYKTVTGVPALWGDPGYAPEERVVARPALDVSGMVCGDTTPGRVKTVIPSKASVKIGVRLVPDQHPETVYAQICAYLKERCPKTVEWKVLPLSRNPCVVATPPAAYLRTLSDALEQSFSTAPIIRRSGGTEPFLGHYQEQLGMGAMEVGFKLPDSAGKGPNENQHLPTLFKGIDTLIRFLVYVGEDNPGGH